MPQIVGPVLGLVEVLHLTVIVQIENLMMELTATVRLATIPA